MELFRHIVDGYRRTTLPFDEIAVRNIGDDDIRSDGRQFPGAVRAEDVNGNFMRAHLFQSVTALQRIRMGRFLVQKELIKKANNKQDYDAIADEIFRLRDQKEKSEIDSHHREEAMNRIKELQDFIAGQETDITEFDETLVKKLIEKITVFADHFSVDFKSGITIDIEA